MKQKPKIHGWDAIIRNTEWAIKWFTWMVATMLTPIIVWLILALNDVTTGATLGWFALASLAVLATFTTIIIIGPPETRPETALASHKERQ